MNRRQPKEEAVTTAAAGTGELAAAMAAGRLKNRQ